MGLKEIGGGGMDWLDVGQDGNKWWERIINTLCDKMQSF
jgi:hypothetical protein